MTAMRGTMCFLFTEDEIHPIIHGWGWGWGWESRGTRNELLAPVEYRGTLLSSLPPLQGVRGWGCQLFRV